VLARLDKIAEREPRAFLTNRRALRGDISDVTKGMIDDYRPQHRRTVEKQWRTGSGRCDPITDAGTKSTDARVNLLAATLNLTYFLISKVAA
jgi:hypothetical protein